MPTDRWYVPMEDDEKVRVRGEVHRLVATRDQKYQSNFVEVSLSLLRSSSMGLMSDVRIQPVPNSESGVQAICRPVLLRLCRRQRQRARLPRSHPPLCRSSRSVPSPALDGQTILTPQRPLLDAFFGNVCELDLVFQFHRVYAILDEIFLAGEIEETSKAVILDRLEYLEKLD